MKDRIRKKMEKAKRQKVHDILELVLLKNEGKDSVFFQFSGHTKGVDIDIFKGGWTSDRDDNKTNMYVYLDSDYGKNTLEEMKQALEVL